VALKRGVGDHTPERFADHELGSCYRGRSDVVARGEMPYQRINAVGIPPFVLQQLRQRMEQRRQDWQLPL
jgi:hypothetical protein